MKGKTIIAVIPARGGSKRLPGKNVKLLAGKPLISHTIIAAKKTGVFADIIVSTDSQSIARVAKKAGASVPFIRPAFLAQDDTPTLPVIKHAIQFWEKKNKKRVDAVVILQPTSPFRTSADIRNSLNLLFSKKADTVVSVTKMQHLPHWFVFVEKGLVREFVKGGLCQERAGKPHYFVLNGAIYATTRKQLFKTLFGKKTLAYEMPQERSIDIDEPFDFKIAQSLARSTKRRPTSVGGVV